MPLLSSDYKRPFYLPNGHAETIIPALTRKIKGLKGRRKRITLPDGDFLDLDIYENFHQNSKAKRLVLIAHGLEGSSQSQYAQGMARAFVFNNYDVIVWNQRGCSGELNKKLRFYHSGATEDLRAVVNYLLKHKSYSQILPIGFSLGGNLTLKYLGEEGKNLPAEIQAAIVFSVPLHLSSCAHKLGRPSNRVYSERFLRSLKDKVARKSAVMPDKLSTEHFPKIKTLKDLDDFYTAPLHGFRDAEDYYEQCSSVNFISDIRVPTLVVNAMNDPFLAPECFPFENFQNLKNVFFETPKTGGHCGFSVPFSNLYWSERRALAFANEFYGY